MFYNRVAFNNDRWPFGKDGPLIILSGTTYTIATGSTKDYSSIYIEANAVLRISGNTSLTTIGSRGPVIIHGRIESVGSVSGYSGLVSTPDSNVTPYDSGLRSGGGRGGDGWFSAADGGPQFNGRGGGGGGGYTGSGVGGKPGNWGLNDVTLGNGANGKDTSNGFGTGDANGGGGGGGRGYGRGLATQGDQGGGGAGGGYTGIHGSHLYIKTRSTIMGSGLIDASGSNGFNGGIGGTGSGTSGTGGTGGGGGGGGGGGSGGNGGSIWIYSKYVTIPVTSNYGNGGDGGAGGPGAASRTGQAGADGSPGTVGYITIVALL